MSDVKDVVVRLPLSAYQEETLFEISERDCLNSAIAAIGTPVAGGELEVVGYADGDEIDAFSPDGNINPCAVIFAEEATVHNVPLVRQSDAQAALATAQAEIVRLNAKQPHYDRMVQENGELKLAVARLQSQDDKALTQVIEERDECERVIADLYQAAMGDPPEWSNNFGYRDAVEDVVDYVHALRTKALKGPAA